MLLLKSFKKIQIGQWCAARFNPRSLPPHATEWRFTFITRGGLAHLCTRTYVGLLDPCFKTGRMTLFCQHLERKTMWPHRSRSTDCETRTARSPHPHSQRCALPPRLKDVRFYNLGAGDKRLVHGASNENHCWPPYRTRARLLSLIGTHADQVRSKVPRGLLV